MRVLFTNAPWFTRDSIGMRAGSRWAHLQKKKSQLKHVTFPFRMAYSAAILEKHGIKVGVIDALAEELSNTEFLNRVEKFSPDKVSKPVPERHSSPVSITAHKVCSFLL